MGFFSRRCCVSWFGGCFVSGVASLAWLHFVYYSPPPPPPPVFFVRNVVYKNTEVSYDYKLTPTLSFTLLAPTRYKHRNVSYISAVATASFIYYRNSAGELSPTYKKGHALQSVDNIAAANATAVVTVNPPNATTINVPFFPESRNYTVTIDEGFKPVLRFYNSSMDKILTVIHVRGEVKRNISDTYSTSLDLISVYIPLHTNPDISYEILSNQ